MTSKLLLCCYSGNIYRNSTQRSSSSWLQPIKMEYLKCCWGVCATCLHRRFRSYHTLKEDVMIPANQSSRANICSGASTVRNLLNRRGAVDHCPLLQDRPVWTFTTHPNATKQHRFRLLSIFLYFFFYTFSKGFKCYNWDLNQYFWNESFLDLLY